MIAAIRLICYDIRVLNIVSTLLRFSFHLRAVGRTWYTTLRISFIQIR